MPAPLFWSIEGAIAHPEASRGATGIGPKRLRFAMPYYNSVQPQFKRLARASVGDPK